MSDDQDTAPVLDCKVLICVLYTANLLYTSDTISLSHLFEDYSNNSNNYLLS